jgi:hypothetical protein
MDSFGFLDGHTRYLACFYTHINYSMARPTNLLAARFAYLPVSGVAPNISVFLSAIDNPV